VPIQGIYGGNTVVLNPSVAAGTPTQGSGTMYNYPDTTTPTPDVYDAISAIFYGADRRHRLDWADGLDRADGHGVGCVVW
jgi:hypothetical protein